MKYFFHFILTIILFGCNNSNTKSTVDKSNKADTVKITDTTNRAKTEHSQIAPQTSATLPKEFSADTINRKDTSLNFNTDIVYLYLKDTTQIKLKQLVYKIINSKLQEFKKQLSKPAKDKANPLNADADLPSSFEAFYDNYYEDNNIASIRYIISVYFSGGVHPFAEYVSINYDKKTKKIFSSKDYLNVKTSKDTLLILTPLEKAFGLLSENLANGNLWGFYKLNDDNFTITKDSISFNFSDYAIGQGPSMLDCKISRNEIKNIVKLNYR